MINPSSLVQITSYAMAQKPDRAKIESVMKRWPAEDAGSATSSASGCAGRHC